MNFVIELLFSSDLKPFVPKKGKGCIHVGLLFYGLGVKGCYHISPLFYGKGVKGCYHISLLNEKSVASQENIDEIF